MSSGEFEFDVLPPKLTLPWSWRALDIPIAPAFPPPPVIQPKLKVPALPDGKPPTREERASSISAALAGAKANDVGREGTEEG